MKMNISWTNQEDQCLRELVKQSGKSLSWIEIAQVMNSQFKGRTRFPKQCRQRFINNIGEKQEGNLSNTWNSQEIGALFSNYKQMGSRWTQIAKKIPGKTQNSVKNKFYGSLRKTIRSLNRKLRSISKKNKKQIQLKSVMKIFQYAEGHFRLQPDLLLKSQDLRRVLLVSAQNDGTIMGIEQIKEIVDKINEFSIATRSYKSHKKSFLYSRNERSAHLQAFPQQKSQQKSQSSQKATNQGEAINLNLQQKGSILKQNQKQSLFQNQKKQIDQIQLKQNQQMVELREYQNIFMTENNQKWDRMYMEYILPEFESILNINDLI